MRTIRDAEVLGKTVLTRVDFNVPIDESGKITDDLRIVTALPTIRYLTDHGAKVILCSHLGRPKGVPDPKCSLKPVAKKLSELIGMPVLFSDDDEVVGEKTVKLAQEFKSSDGKLMMLQNVRFRKEEEENDPAFAEALANLADLFVMEAFGAAHRAHASTVGVADYIPAYAGFLIEKEVEYLQKTLEHPERPFTVVLGGKKVSDKIGVIDNLSKKADYILIGGAMAFTFLAAQGYETGTSFVETDKLELAQTLLQKEKESGVKLLLPSDITGSTEFSNDTPKREYPVDRMPADFMGLDIGPDTIRRFCEVISSSKTIVMNGPMGVFELSNYEAGTKAVIDAIANFGGVSIIGGGDSAAAVSKFGMDDAMTHISTGGGASLKLLEGKELPGIQILMEKKA
jgi:phosphoglycerate kinase